jgi:hypothetical protein
MITADISERALEARARRAARKIGLIARKSRWRVGTIDNYGEFMLTEPMRNICVAGSRWDMTADDVLEYCNEGPSRG